MDKDLDIHQVITLFVKAGIKNKWVLILILIVSVVAGFFIDKNEKYYYEYEAIIYSNPTIGEITPVIVRDFNYMIERKDTVFLSSFGKNKTDLYEIKELKLELIENNDNLFLIKLLTSEKMDVNPVGEALLNYIINNPLSIKMKNIDIKRYERTIDFIDLEEKKIDSFLNKKLIVNDFGKLIEANLLLHDKKHDYIHKMDKINLSCGYLKPFGIPRFHSNLRKHIMLSLFVGSILIFLIIIVTIIKEQNDLVSSKDIS